MTDTIFENIQNEDLKKFAKEELINGLTPIGYDVTDEKEIIKFQGIGEIDYLLWVDKNQNEVMESHVLQSTGEKINFSEINQEANTEISYYLRRGYRLVQIDDLKTPKYVLLYNVENYQEFVELEYDDTFKRLQTKCFSTEKINALHALLEKTKRL